MEDLRVLVVAEDVLARTGLAAIVGEAEPSWTIAQLAPERLALDVDIYQPDIVLFDLAWGDATDIAPYIEATDAPFLFLLADEEQAALLLATVGDMVAVRPIGLLLRSNEAPPILYALSTVVAGLSVIDPSLMTALTPQLSPAALADEIVEPLTPREQEVLALIAEGLPNKAIALRLGISDHTVKFHINAILSKLNAQSRTEAVVQAARLGLLIL
ncbi:MAG: DNA-binding response regulator [Chloroflexi bacterium]|nr:MAG: DNA-binding response regulator [Chloroflexota bacterium]